MNDDRRSFPRPWIVSRERDPDKMTPGDLRPTESGWRVLDALTFPDGQAGRALPVRDAAALLSTIALAVAQLAAAGMRPNVTAETRQLARASGVELSDADLATDPSAVFGHLVYLKELGFVELTPRGIVLISVDDGGPSAGLEWEMLMLDFLAVDLEHRIGRDL